MSEGWADGVPEGDAVSLLEGLNEGFEVGSCEGTSEGRSDADCEGRVLRAAEGPLDGMFEDCNVGFDDQIIEGLDDGLTVNTTTCA